MGGRANERQVGGNHYKQEDGGEEHWDRMYRLFGPGYLIGCITKYVERFQSKNGIEDLYKAQHFLEKLIELFTEQELKIAERQRDEMLANLRAQIGVEHVEWIASEDRLGGTIVIQSKDSKYKVSIDNGVRELGELPRDVLLNELNRRDREEERRLMDAHRETLERLSDEQVENAFQVPAPDAPMCGTCNGVLPGHFFIRDEADQLVPCPHSGLLSPPPIGQKLEPATAENAVLTCSTCGARLDLPGNGHGEGCPQQATTHLGEHGPAGSQSGA